MAVLPPRKPLDPIVKAAQDQFDETLAYVQKQHAISGELLAQKATPTFDLVLFRDFSYSLQGTSLITDLAEQTEKAKVLNELYISKEPESDDEIAHRANQVKAIKEGRAEFKEFRRRIKGEFITLAEFDAMADAFDAIMQNTQAIGEDQVKNFKSRKIADIKARYQKLWNDEFLRLSKVVAPLTLEVAKPDFEKAMKSKKTFASLEESAKNEVAFCVSLAERVAIGWQQKLEIIRANTGLQFLFADIQELVVLDMAELKCVIIDRVTNYQEAEAKKAEALRIKIAAEEKAKAEKLKLDELQKIEDARLAEQNRLEREARAKQAADDLAKAEALKAAAARTNEAALRAETGAEMRKDQARAVEMIETAKKLEADAPKKLNPEMPSLQRVLAALQKAFFLTMPEAEQLLSDSADELEKRRYQHMHDKETPGLTAAGHAE